MNRLPYLALPLIAVGNVFDLVSLETIGGLLMVPPICLMMWRARG